MKPQRFEIGQAITPRTNEPFYAAKGELLFDPKASEIYHVRDYATMWHGEWCIRLQECPYDRQTYFETDFSPVITTHELESELSEIETGVVV